MASAIEKPRATVIVATYENPKALRLVFEGLRRQTHSHFEILVADDGSGRDTERTIERFASQSALVVRRVWQPDRGLRKSRILNRSILAAAGEDLIFLDGDCVPGPRFVERHLDLHEPGTYRSGSCILLGDTASAALTAEAVARGALDGLGSLRPGNRRARRLVATALPGLPTLLDRTFAADPVGFHGGNASVARVDALAVGGFDERLARFEDKDFGARLRRHGLRGTSVRYRIPVWHLHHERAYADQAMRDSCRRIYEANTAAGIVRTEHGLVRDPAADPDTTRE